MIGNVVPTSGKCSNYREAIELTMGLFQLSADSAFCAQNTDSVEILFQLNYVCTESVHVSAESVE